MFDIDKEVSKLRSLNVFRNVEDKEEYYLVTCPFHGDGRERTPSLGINKKNLYKNNGNVVEKGFVNCFACGYKARFTKFLSDIYKVPEFDIIVQFKRDKLFEERREIDVKFSRNTKESKKKEIINYEPLPLSSKGREYLIKRKLDIDILQEFKITSDKNDNVVFPLIDKDGDIIGLQARGTSTKYFNNTKNLDKLNFLYALYQLKKEKYVGLVFVVESVIDCLTLWSWGFRGVALMGVVFSEFHIQELIKLGCPIILAFDNDEAGRLATDKMSRVLVGRGIRCSKLKWSREDREKDINDLSKSKLLSILRR